MVTFCVGKSLSSRSTPIQAVSEPWPLLIYAWKILDVPEGELQPSLAVGTVGAYTPGFI
jgi:hypothetical protein